MDFDSLLPPGIEPLPEVPSPASVPMDVYLDLLAQSEARKDALLRLEKTVKELRLRHETALAEYREEVAKLHEKVTIRTQNERRALNQLVVVSQSLCPVLREYLLIRAALRVSPLTPCGTENERNARDMLGLLQQWEGK